MNVMKHGGYSWLISAVILFYGSTACYGMEKSNSAAPIETRTLQKSEPAGGPASASETGTPEVAPKSVVLENRFDFGSAVEGTTVTHEFTIENQGAGVLIIEDVKTT